MNKLKSDNLIDKEIWYTIKSLKEEFLQSGYDFFPLLLRYPLSKTLGRAKRLELGTDTEKVYEYRSLLELQYQNKTIINKKNKNKQLGFKDKLLNKLKAKFGLDKKSKIPANQIFIPIYSDRIESVCNKLSDQAVLVIGEKESPANFKHIFYSYVQEVIKYKVDERHALKVFERLQGYIKDKGYILDAYSKNFLFGTIINIFRDIEYVKHVYENLSPKLILLFKDTYSPSQLFSILSKEYKTKVVLLQHGLDCEHYFLDDVYTKEVILWGNYRKDRYINDSEFQSNFRVLGNPNMDQIKKMPVKVNFERKWLFITRPHHSPFCYSFSRKVNEGLNILKDLTEILNKYDVELTIKPHTNDFVSIYRDCIQQSSSDDICISSGNLKDVLSGVDLVFCEDSSAVLEAMLNGKLIILVHYADSEPTLPVKLWDVVPIARDANELENCIKTYNNLTERDLNRIQEKYDKFIEYCVGSISGNSTEKTVKELYKIINT